MTKRTIAIALALLAAGCASGTSNINPNPEKSLQKKPAEFAQYAKEHSYPTTAPAVPEAPVRAEVDYGLDVIQLVNLGEQDWQDVEVWVNNKYVCHIAVLPVKQQRAINFAFLYDADGNRAPRSGTWIQKIELYHGGSLYNVKVRPAD